MTKIFGTSPEDQLDKDSFVQFVELLTNQLAKNWKDEQKVAVVKLTIQSAKMLSDPGIVLIPNLSFITHAYEGLLFQAK